MRKYKILVLTNNPTHAHGAVLKNTFGKRPYAGVTQRKYELVLKYDDAEITIMRSSSGSFGGLRGVRVDEVWIDEYVSELLSEEEKNDLRTILFQATSSSYRVTDIFPHYANRQAINYFSKDDDGYGR